MSCLFANLSLGRLLWQKSLGGAVTRDSYSFSWYSAFGEMVLVRVGFMVPL